jgi:hypothetical protein
VAVTQRDIVDSIIGLRGVARDLRQATDSPLVAGVSPTAVPLSVEGLIRHATYLETVADELQTLIPTKKISIPE